MKFSRRRSLGAIATAPLMFRASPSAAEYNKEACKVTERHLGWTLKANAFARFTEDDPPSYRGLVTNITATHDDSSLWFRLNGATSKTLLDEMNNGYLPAANISYKSLLSLFKPSFHPNGPMPFRTFLMITNLDDHDDRQHITTDYSPICVAEFSIDCPGFSLPVELSESHPTTKGWESAQITPPEEAQRTVSIINRAKRIKLEIGYKEQNGNAWPRLATYEIETQGLLATINSANRAVLDKAEQYPQDACKSSGACFLTTACCTYMGRADDCIELQTLRAFRDGWLANQPEGRAMIADYYQIAPALCRAIDGNSALLRRLYWGTILPCVIAIRLGANQIAFRLYRRMIRSLQTSFPAP